MVLREDVGQLSDISVLVAVISTLISSVALVGVMIGLLLQLRQLKISRLQALRATHIELIRMSLDYPEAWVDPADPLSGDVDTYRHRVQLNWRLQHLQFGYVVGAVTEPAMRAQLARLLRVPLRREWWTAAREFYKVEARTRRERRFCEIVDDELRHAVARSAKPATEAESANE